MVLSVASRQIDYLWSIPESRILVELSGCQRRPDDSAGQLVELGIGLKGDPHAVGQPRVGWSNKFSPASAHYPVSKIIIHFPHLCMRVENGVHLAVRTA